MAGSLDDAFANFLNEIETVDTGGAEPAPPSPKRARGGHVEDEQADAESKAAAKRKSTAERLRKASYRGDVAAVEKLLGALSAVDRLLLVDSADPDDGLTALHLAVIRGHISVVELLIRFRADVDAASDAGDTPLMWAAHSGNMAACKTLLRAGADISLKNAVKNTATMQARSAGHRRIAEMIDNHAFDVAVGLKRKGAAAMDAAAARRAANMKLIEDALRQQKEKEEEEAFWDSVRKRREGRESEEQAKGAAAPSAAEASRSETQRAFAEEEVASVPVRMRPHYKTLEVPPDATEDEVRKLYRKAALRHHPDKNPKNPVAAKERFTAIAIAYEAICEYLGSVETVGVRIAPPSF